MITPDDIKMWIEAGLSGSQVDVTGEGRHFDAVLLVQSLKVRALSNVTSWFTVC